MSSILYLVDANILISAANGLYQIDRVPQFWAWLETSGRGGRIAVPTEIWEEIKDGSDLLAEWSKSSDFKDSLLLNEEAQPHDVRKVVAEGYAPDLDDTELGELGMDPFLIAYALTDPAKRVVVSGEVSKPSLRRARRRVPDACNTLGVRCIDLIGLINEANFRIG